MYYDLCIQINKCNTILQGNLFVLFKVLRDYSKYYSVGKWQYIFTLMSHIKMKNKNQLPPEPYPLKTPFILRHHSDSYTQIYKTNFLLVNLLFYLTQYCDNNNLYCRILYYT